MKKAFLIIAALVAPTAAFAAPAHLECDLAGGPDGPVLRWQITVNEEERRVYYSHPQDSGRSPATFSAEEVRFFGGDLRINRNDLTLKRVVHLGGGEMMETTGQCRIVQRQGQPPDEVTDAGLPCTGLLGMRRIAQKRTQKTTSVNGRFSLQYL